MYPSTLKRVALLAFCVLWLAGCRANPTEEQLVMDQPSMQSSETSSEVVIEGQIVPQAYVTLSFEIPGKIAEVLVQEGQAVKAEQVIARLVGDEQVEAAVKAAELELLNAKQSLQALTDNHETVLNDALLALNAARQAVHDTESYLDSITGDRLQNEIAGAEAQLVLAESRLENAIEDYEDYEDEDEDNTTRATYRVLLSEAQRAYDEAVHLLNNLQGDGYEFTLQQTKTTLEACNTQLQLAEARYSELVTGPDPDLVDAAEARLAAAEAGLASAQANIRQLEMRAPLDGRLVESYLKVGEVAVAGQPMGKLADLSSWYVETLELTEIDVVAVSEGQSVQVIADALPEVVMKGKVMSISETYEELRGDVTYTALIKLEEVDSRLRWGMTVLITFHQP